MENYPSNSYKSRQEKTEVPEAKTVEKVTTGSVKAKKRSSLSKFVDAVVQEDMATVKNYIFSDVIVPSIKKAISDVVTNGVDMVLYGETRNRKTSSSPASKVSYRSYYDDGRSSRRVEARSAYDYDEIIFNTRSDAEEVLLKMDEILDKYKVISVLDFFDLAGVTGKHTDNKYGWTDIRTASVVRTIDGYVIKLPRPLPID